MAPKVAKLPESEVMIPMRIGSGAARAPGPARKTQRTRRRSPSRTRMISPAKGSARARRPRHARLLPRAGGMVKRGASDRMSGGKTRANRDCRRARRREKRRRRVMWKGMTLAAGTHVGPYEIEGLLGVGGMGEVYRARDPRIGRDVAIKVLPALWSHDRDRLRRFEQEARAAGALSHPALLTIYDVGEQDGTPYLVSELLEGETLRTRLFGGPLSPRRAIEYAIQIARGLAVAHG